MKNYFVVIAVITAFIWYDIVLFAAQGSSASLRAELLESLQRRALRLIDLLFKVYCRFRLSFENVSGSELPPRFLLVANHQSLLDIPMVMIALGSRRLRFVAKRELGTGVPFVSALLRQQGHALVNRKGDAKSSMRAIRRFARRCAAEGTCPAIFPEGTRSLGLGTFHTAGVRKILETDRLPMAVVVIDGGWRVSKLKDIFKNLTGAEYRVKVLAVLPPPTCKKESLESLEFAKRLIAADLVAFRLGEGTGRPEQTGG
ncbi:MAG: lysophospholipid acyltransferase family protein [Spirochaetaceae bacterium]|nr:lysophospholipid acyltransferase family protein [Spirochaetaceae bacterium]